MQFGRTYEEFEVGAVYKHWPGKTVTEYDDHLFCLLTMNHHPLHLDANYAARATDFGQNVVVGNYIYSLLLGMSVPDVSGKAIANLEVDVAQARGADLPRRHHLRPEHRARQAANVHARPGRSSRSRPAATTKTEPVVCVFRRKVMVPTRDLHQRARRRTARPS